MSGGAADEVVVVVAGVEEGDGPPGLEEASMAPARGCGKGDERTVVVAGRGVP